MVEVFRTPEDKDRPPANMKLANTYAGYFFGYWLSRHYFGYTRLLGNTNNAVYYRRLMGNATYNAAGQIRPTYTSDPGDASDGRLDPSQGGRWHRPWDPQLQAEWMDAVYKLAFSKPYVESVAWADLADMSHSLPGCGLLDDMLKPKPSYVKLQELRERFHQWHLKKG